MNAIQRSWFAGALMCTLLAAACTTTPPEAFNIENVQTMPATVESVDLERRLVTLRTSQGRTATLGVGPGVSNLGRVRPGSSVVVRYYQSLAARLKKKGKGAGTAANNRNVVGSVARNGDPGASSLTTTVVVESVDQSRNTVTFRESNGPPRTVAVQTPGGKQFIERLKRGDEVELTFTESFAFGVLPAT